MINDIILLGSTGSIGTQTLEVAEKLGIKVRALSAHRNIGMLGSQLKRFKPDYAVITDRDAYERFMEDGPYRTKILYGQEGLSFISGLKAGMAVNALVGFAGLRSTLDAIDAGNDIALANKESLVVFGEQIMKETKAKKIRIIPVDSEHSAVFQCLEGQKKESVREIILTASGGPFRDTPVCDLPEVTVEQALEHPNWKMGKKITVDSATMMNKGLEVIEASRLFEMDRQSIKVVIQRESIIHSMVGFTDGSYMAQLGLPDMKIPIAYALSYPERTYTGAGFTDFCGLGAIHFEEADLKRYACLKLAYDVLGYKNSMAAVMNAANEICVDAFLRRRIRFTDIAVYISIMIEKHADTDLSSYESVFAIDAETRAKTEELIGGKKCR